MNRGSHAGLTARTVQKLMRSSYYMAKKKLKVLRTKTEIVELEDIGDMIYEYRKTKEGIGIDNFDLYSKFL